MAREIPLGATRYAGNSDVVLPCQFEGDLVAGVAVSSVAISGEQPKVALFNGSAFAGFAVHDLCNVRKVTGVVEQGKGIPVRVKKLATLTVGNGFAVDNTTGEVVPVGAADSTTIMGKIDELGINGLDENCEIVEGCALVTLYGGSAPAGSGAAGVTSVNGATGDVTIAAADIGAVEEAPEDGSPYERQDAGWVAAGVAASAPAPESAETGAKTASRTIAKK
ncbi:hypothetical protein [Vibrio alginolyticus]|uniref:hypothetical protein n=1 Tax=Vibrio alginolyticus TaxID=663 RepID=UPI00072043C7|nr:hypothetical protein [Vibrio alginolyticus]ALR91306.1 hypothetical protein AT730_02465 [Vibrio alginolyticus]MBY7707977.1 hypothetical protein [Vibrio alginolyticus]PNP21969.1 hypothetical protein AL471_014430 [Vibrio alginolyticus]